MTRSNNQCSQCGIVQEGDLRFIVGAKSSNPHSKDDWCLVQGSGRLVCPACYPSELERGKAVIEKYIADFNARAKAQST